MPNLIALSTLFTLALSLPTPTTAHQLPTVHLQTFGPSTSSFSPSLQKSTLSNGGQIISIPLGASLSSLADKPLELQGIELVGVEGAALDDVECRAQISWSSRSGKCALRKG
ncbi:hypothetical protein CC86DRAFT_153384 [Ophiobolus disseminans]|uniref:Uncharacterized protein n=1 Tax=Ophiobolus disseminans TaxID=1469910 RepID=A0A6A6ZCM6_9PLEO|nr:hypothetical protein CC86DRAFT_153384 [Ophiobolus disseminans]